MSLSISCSVIWLRAVVKTVLPVIFTASESAPGPDWSTTWPSAVNENPSIASVKLKLIEPDKFKLKSNEDNSGRTVSGVNKVTSVKLVLQTHVL
jgi:hypothetical protein